MFRGREVKTTGDGVLAVFDSPARAVQCAAGMVRSTREIGIEIRAGVHTGEIEAVGDDVRGIAVHTAARVLALAAPGEVLVSATTAGLLEGSGLVLEDAGLVARQKTGRVVSVSLTPNPMAEAMTWLRRYERFWSPRLDRLAAFAETEEKKARESGR